MRIRNLVNCGSGMENIGSRIYIPDPQRSQQGWSCEKVAHQMTLRQSTSLLCEWWFSHLGKNTQRWNSCTSINKRLESFAPCYSHSLLLGDFKENNTGFKNPYNNSQNKKTWVYAHKPGLKLLFQSSISYIIFPNTGSRTFFLVLSWLRQLLFCLRFSFASLNTFHAVPGVKINHLASPKKSWQLTKEDFDKTTKYPPQIESDQCLLYKLRYITLRLVRGPSTRHLFSL